MQGARHSTWNPGDRTSHLLSTSQRRAPCHSRTGLSLHSPFCKVLQMKSVTSLPGLPRWVPIMSVTSAPTSSFPHLVPYALGNHSNTPPWSCCHSGPLHSLLSHLENSPSFFLLACSFHQLILIDGKRDLLTPLLHLPFTPSLHFPAWSFRESMAP